MSKIYVGSHVINNSSILRIVYDNVAEVLRLMNPLYELTKFQIHRESSKRTDPIQEWELSVLYYGSSDRDCSGFTGIDGNTIFPKVEYYPLGTKFLCGQSKYILASTGNDKEVNFTNLETGWTHDGAFIASDGFNLCITSNQVPKSFIAIKE